MELFRKAIEKLEKSEEFKEWKKNHKDCYLTSGFAVVSQEQSPWKAAYYNDESKKATSFVIDKKIIIEPEEDILQKEQKKPKKIEIEKLSVDLPQAIVAANNLQKEKYKGDDPIKIMAIVQNDDNFSLIWNMILVTQKMNALNIKIDANEGKVVEHKIESIMNFRKE